MISVIIPTRKRPDKIKKLLLSLHKYADQYLSEVIVVANEHEPEKESWISKQNLSFKLSYYYTGKRGVNHARNLGLKVKSPFTNWTLFLDDDCFFENSLQYQKLVQILLTTKFDGVGGTYNFIQGSTINKVYYLKKKAWLFFYSHSQGSERLLGGYMAFKSKTLENICFNEKIKFGGSETDFILNYCEKFKVLVYPELIIGHEYDDSFFVLFKKFFKQGQHHATVKTEKHQSKNNISFAAIYLNLLETQPWSEHEKNWTRRMTMFHNCLFKIGILWGRFKQIKLQFKNQPTA